MSLILNNSTTPSTTPTNANASSYSSYSHFYPHNLHSSHPPQPTLLTSPWISKLRSTDEEERNNAARSLAKEVSFRSRDMKSSDFSQWISALYRSINQILQSNVNCEKLAGLLAIDFLLEELDENTISMEATAGALKQCLLRDRDDTVLDVAAKTFGNLLKKLVQVRSSFTAELVVAELKRCLEALDPRHKQERRYSAVLLLAVIADKAPSIFYIHVSSFIHDIWYALHDREYKIRTAASKALKQCLQVIKERDANHDPQHAQWYDTIYVESWRGLNTDKIEIAHGSLLAIGELLRTGKFPSEKYDIVANYILKCITKNNFKLVAITLIPPLAHYSPSMFEQSHLANAMKHLLSMLKKLELPGHIFEVVGEVALAMKGSFMQYLEPVVEAIVLAIPPRPKGPIPNEVLVCIKMLVESLGPLLTPHVEKLLVPLFGTGLTKELVDVLSAFALNIPATSNTIQFRLLDLIAKVLDIKDIRRPNDSQFIIRRPTNQNLQFSLERSPQLIVVALNTLGTFAFIPWLVKDYLRTIVTFLTDDNEQIRKAAVVTCCNLMINENTNELSPQSHSAELINGTLSHLLKVCILDSNPKIRKRVLKLLTTKTSFEVFLAQPDNIRTLIVAMSDQHFKIRELAAKSLSTLTSRNPAVVVPFLRKKTIQLVTELKLSLSIQKDSVQKEQTVCILGHVVGKMIDSSPSWIEQLLEILLQLFLDSAPRVVSYALRALSQLVKVGWKTIMAYIETHGIIKVMNPIVDAIQDQSSSSKRLDALKTLTDIIKWTGYVIKPLTQYPQLLSLLVNTIKTEQMKEIRIEAARLIGYIGAIDPYHHRQNVLRLKTTRKAKKVQKDSQSVIPPNISTYDTLILQQDFTTPSPSSESFYPTIALNALIRILKDPTLEIYHTQAITALGKLFTGLGNKIVPFLPLIIQSFLFLLQHSLTMRKYLFHELANLVSIITVHIKDYVDDLFKEFKKCWDVDLACHILELIERMSMALGDSFLKWMPESISYILMAFKLESEKIRRALSTLRTLDCFLNEYLHMLIPDIVSIFDGNCPESLKIYAIDTIGFLSRRVDFTEYSALIIHPLVRILEQNSSNSSLRAPSALSASSGSLNFQEDIVYSAVETLCKLAVSLGRSYVMWVPLVKKTMEKHHLYYEKYFKIEEAVTCNRIYVDDLEEEQGPMQKENALLSLGLSKDSLFFSDLRLRQAWDTSCRSKQEDWVEWMRGFSNSLLRDSPSPALRSCLVVSEYYPIVRELFNAGFLSCWSALKESLQQNLVDNLKAALLSPEVPPDIVQALLGLAEFMEHDEKPLPIETSLLGNLALQCRAYGKALYYKELEFKKNPSNVNAMSSLISIYTLIGQHYAAEGILKMTRKHQTAELDEKLGRWQEALDGYAKKSKFYSLDSSKEEDVTIITEEKTRLEDGDVVPLCGIMNCLAQLGEWKKLGDLCSKVWNEPELDNKTDVRMKVSSFAAKAACQLKNYPLMEQYVSSLDNSTTVDSAMLHAILKIYSNDFESAQFHINKAREYLDTELAILVGESYQRAYDLILTTQQLAEMEEILELKKLSKSIDKERASVILTMWKNRLFGVQKSSLVWQKMLQVRSIYLEPLQETRPWLKLSVLCRKDGHLALARKTLDTVLGTKAAEFQSDLLKGKLNLDYPDVTYAYLKQLWAENDNQIALSNMQKLSSRVDGNPQLQARIAHKVGSWLMNQLVKDGLQLDEMSISQINDTFYISTQLAPKWQKGWHSWAMINFEALQFHNQGASRSNLSEIKMQDITRKHLMNAIVGFMRSISFNNNNNPRENLQDLLRLLTLFFQFPVDVYPKFMDGLSSINIEIWLQVIPQIIARIHSKVKEIHDFCCHLLTLIGKTHPQALVFPLCVASTSILVARAQAAQNVMAGMRDHSATLLDQTSLVAKELVRSSILWSELWHEALGEATKLYYWEKNFTGLYNRLQVAHEQTKCPETINETSFDQTHGRDLEEAWSWLKKFIKSNKMQHLTKAWDLYYPVFHKLDKQLPTITRLELEHLSPQLFKARNLDVAVPGTYKPNLPVVNISHFDPVLKIIPSKQRPRRMLLFGSDGLDWTFLLKGHEDLRQDERVMQLFGLVNMLLKKDGRTHKFDLDISRYRVIPLSPNSGLISWVAHSDTLHQLIRDYRSSKNIELDKEYQEMLSQSQHYEKLPVMNKVEIFTSAMSNAVSDDLARVLWLRSPNSEVWMLQRLNYTCSLAVMSMVGYILGLGDRHPSNLMLDRYTGKVIHIDFGDCFEVAMKRDKYPEKIPFRLTRMLVNAMEVSGIEGTFRITCENVMTVLRENRESLMAVLEAFVHDPLLNWRLLTKQSPKTMDPIDPNITLHFESQSTIASFSSRPVLNSLPVVYSDIADHDVVNSRAIEVLKRIKQKLVGRDFHATSVLEVSQQVDYLLKEASDPINLCQSYFGWCPFW